MIWPPIRFSHNTVNYDLPVPAPAPPSADNWLGTDDQGRDVLARLIYGLRISVLFGLLLTLSSSLIGVAAGAVQGYFGGRLDLLFQRFLEIWGGLPQLFILIIVYRMLARDAVPASRRGPFTALLRTSPIFARLARRSGGSGKGPAEE